MNVVEFSRSPKLIAQGWRTDELQRVANACAGSVAKGEVSGWELGETEAGDPQVYVIGPPPNYECILCISRIGRHYIIEDGNGQVVFENGSFAVLAEQAVAALSRRKTAIVARIAIAWCAIREAIEEKTEALMAEPLEVLTHVAPQLASLV
jgi:hypothetical protein